ncbi:MAG: 50S ribosomal protein L22 [Candidatus Spechtbacteria bacterium]|nr:50S ribosomal protein L22 [Candidatus Spechtbacteria bacterium]
MPTATAKLSYMHIAPRKVRLVADVIRGMRVDRAEEQLRFSRKRAAHDILKLLKSAQANARGSEKDVKNPAPLYVRSIVVEQGPAYKRYHPQSRGRAALIKKITSHVKIELAEKETK